MEVNMCNDETAIRLDHAIEKLSRRIDELQQQIEDLIKSDIWRLEDRASNCERAISQLENEVRYR
jgi:prefoldin subunit 5